MINKRTKIVATISDRSSTPEFLRKIHDAGVDVIRLNTAHQTPKDTLKVINQAREVSERIALLIDTKGPEIRTTEAKQKIFLKKGETIVIKGCSNNSSNKISTREILYVNYPAFARSLPVGTSILIDDGEIELIVEKRKVNSLICKAKDAGEIGSRKSVNVPGVHINLPSLSKKDKEYVLFAVKHNVDFIAHSFVRNKHDILAIQKILNKHNSKVKIIAKIENKEGVDNIDEILDYAYGIMVARGDLAIEIPAEQVPQVQKELIKKCITRQKPVITATQMLHTMIKNPRPTRAEVSDVANAVMDGTDALMLSGETAYGEYPLESVKMMSKIAVATENHVLLTCGIPVFQSDNKITSYIARSAVELSQQLNVKEIMVSSKSGFSAALIASYRGTVPVFVKCFNGRRMRELALTYGVNAHLVKPAPGKQLRQRVLSRLVKKGKLKKTDLIIHLASDIDTESTANFLEIGEVGKYIK